MNYVSLCSILRWHALSIRYGCVWVVDLFDELPPAVYRWPASLPRICRQLWPLYTSAGIFLYVTPGGKLQLLVLLTQSDNGNKDIMLKTLTKVEKICHCTQNIGIILKLLSYFKSFFDFLKTIISACKFTIWSTLKNNKVLKSLVRCFELV